MSIISISIIRFQYVRHVLKAIDQADARHETWFWKLPLFDYSIEHTVAILSSQQQDAYNNQPDNIIRVKAWDYEVDDTQLLALLPFLEECAAANNCLDFLKTNKQRLDDLLARSAGQLAAIK